MMCVEKGMCISYTHIPKTLNRTIKRGVCYVCVEKGMCISYTHIPKTLNRTIKRGVCYDVC